MLIFFKVLTMVVGVAMSVGYFPQVYRIYKTKSAESVSLSSFIIFALGTLTRTLYGFVVHDIVLIMSFIVGVVGSRRVLFLTIRYRMKTKRQHKK